LSSLFLCIISAILCITSSLLCIIPTVTCIILSFYLLSQLIVCIASSLFMYYPRSWTLIFPTLVFPFLTHAFSVGFSPIVFITPSVLHNCLS
jgi:hypothetical protein